MQNTKIDLCYKINEVLYNDADKKAYMLTYSNEHLIDFIEKILYLVKCSPNLK
jgi:hypothetical protein